MPDLIPFAVDGQWIEVPKDGIQEISCCDCGLVHRMQFRIVNRPDGSQYIQWQGFRDEERTKEVRDSGDPGSHDAIEAWLDLLPYNPSLTLQEVKNELNGERGGSSMDAGIQPDRDGKGFRAL